MKWKMLTFVIAFLVHISSAPGNDGSKADLFNENIVHLQKKLDQFATVSAVPSDRLMAVEEVMCFDLNGMYHTVEGATESQLEEASKLAVRVLDGGFGPDAGCAALGLLRKINVPIAYAQALLRVNDAAPKITTTAAWILLEAGRWDIGAKVLDSLGDYDKLTRTRDIRAVSILKEATQGKSDAERCLKAAYYLGTVFDQWEIPLQSVRYWTETVGLKLPVNTAILGLKILAIAGDNQDVSIAGEFLNSDSPILIRTSLESLASMADRGVASAHDKLMIAAESSRDAVKIPARIIIRNLDSEK